MSFNFHQWFIVQLALSTTNGPNGSEALTFTSGPHGSQALIITNGSVIQELLAHYKLGSSVVQTFSLYGKKSNN